MARIYKPISVLQEPYYWELPGRGSRWPWIVCAGATILGVFLFATYLLWARAVPELMGRVNDYAQMLGPQAERYLEGVLQDLERTDGTQIVVLTIPSLEGESLEGFSIRVAEQWKIGREENDSGAILMISKQDRKIRMEVGYGLEGRLTDLMSGRIIRNVIAPQFKQGQFDQGVIDGVAAMIGTVKGEYTASRSPRQARPKSGGPGLMGIFILLFLINVIGRVNRFMGAATAGILAPIAGLLFFKAGLIAVLALVPIGLLGGFVVGLFGPPLSFGPGVNHRRHSNYWGGGGFYSGAFRGLGGGFGGGGGGFGGGGASGGW